jgi:hypothetical protein
MTTSAPTTPPSPSTVGTIVRRVAGVVALSAILFLGLWMMVFTAVKSAIVAGGVGVVLVVASAASDALETIVDTLVSIVLGVLAAIGSFFSGIFGD